MKIFDDDETGPFSPFYNNVESEQKIKMKIAKGANFEIPLLFDVNRYELRIVSGSDIGSWSLRNSSVEIKQDKQYVCLHLPITCSNLIPIAEVQDE